MVEPTPEEANSAFCPMDGQRLSLQERPEDREDGGFVTAGCPLCGIEWEWLSRDQVLVIFSEPNGS